MDYVEFLAEYTPYSLHDLENWARAVELFNMSSMIKVDQATQVYVAQKAIAAGIQNILFVDARDVPGTGSFPVWVLSLDEIS